MEEKRKFVRVPVVVKVTNRATKEFHFFYSRDISQGGLFLESKAPYPMDTEVELDFFLKFKDRKERIVINGKVVRVQPHDILTKSAPTPGMGIEFLSIEPKTLAMLNNFIQELLEGET